MKAFWALLVLSVVACGGSSGLDQDLRLTGAVSRHVTSATPSECQVQGGTYQARLDAGDVSLYIEMRNWHGPGAYQAVYRDSFGAQFYALTMKSGDRTFGATAGSVSVAADLKSGSLAVDLAASDGAPLHVSGSWRCG